MLRTKLICTPSPRCTPAQLRQIKTPNLGDAHCGDGAPQSQQRSFWFVFWISRSCTFVRLRGATMNARESYLRSGLGIYLPHGFARHSVLSFGAFCNNCALNCSLALKATMTSVLVFGVFCNNCAQDCLFGFRGKQCSLKGSLEYCCSRLNVVKQYGIWFTSIQRGTAVQNSIGVYDDVDNLIRGYGYYSFSEPGSRSLAVR